MSIWTVPGFGGVGEDDLPTGLGIASLVREDYLDPFRVQTTASDYEKSSSMFWNAFGPDSYGVKYTDTSAPASTPAAAPVASAAPAAKPNALFFDTGTFSSAPSNYQSTVQLQRVWDPENGYVDINPLTGLRYSGNPIDLIAPPQAAPSANFDVTPLAKQLNEKTLASFQYDPEALPFYKPPADISQDKYTQAVGAFQREVEEYRKKYVELSDSPYQQQQLKVPTAPPDYQGWVAQQFDEAKEQAHEAIFRQRQEFVQNQLLNIWNKAGVPQDLGGMPLDKAASLAAQTLVSKGVRDLTKTPLTGDYASDTIQMENGRLQLAISPTGVPYPQWQKDTSDQKLLAGVLGLGSLLVAPGLTSLLGGGTSGAIGAGAILGGGQSLLTGGDLEDILKGAVTGGVTAGAGQLAGSAANAVNASVLGATESKLLADLASGAVKGGINALPGAISSGNFENVLTGALSGGITGAASTAIKDIGSAVFEATDSKVLADAASAAAKAGFGELPKALITGDFGNVLNAAAKAGVTSGVTSGVANITGLTTKELNAAVDFAKSAAAGDLTKMLSSAATFTDSPDLALAAKAASVVKAIESGDLTKITLAGQAFGKELDSYNNYYSTTDTGDETERLMARYGTSQDTALAVPDYSISSGGGDGVVSGGEAGAVSNLLTPTSLPLGYYEPIVGDSGYGGNYGGSSADYFGIAGDPSGGTLAPPPPPPSELEKAKDFIGNIFGSGKSFLSDLAENVNTVTPVEQIIPAPAEEQVLLGYDDTGAPIYGVPTPFRQSLRDRLREQALSAPPPPQPVRYAAPPGWGEDERWGSWYKTGNNDWSGWLEFPGLWGQMLPKFGFTGEVFDYYGPDEYGGAGGQSYTLEAQKEIQRLQALGYDFLARGGTRHLYQAALTPQGAYQLNTRAPSDLAEVAPLITFMASIAAGPAGASLANALAPAIGATAASVVAPALIQGTIGGIGSAAQGGEFGEGFGKGALTGGLSAGIGSLVEPLSSSIGSNIFDATGNQALADIASGAIKGGAGALPGALISGDADRLLTGALTGGIKGGFNAFGPSMPGAFVDEDIQEGFFEPGGPGYYEPSGTAPSFPEFDQPLLTDTTAPGLMSESFFPEFEAPLLTDTTAPGLMPEAFFPEFEAPLLTDTTAPGLMPGLSLPDTKQGTTPITPVEREAFLEANIEDPLERLLARPIDEVDWSAVYGTPTTNPVTGETIVGADQTGYPVQDFGTLPQSDINEVYDRIINDMGGFASTWQTVGSDRIMIQDDGSAIGINTETNESYGLTSEETQRMIDAGLLNTDTSGYGEAIRGTTTAPPPAAPSPAPRPPAAPPPAPAPAPRPPAPAPAPKKQDDLALLMMLASMMGQQQQTPEPYQVAQINARNPFGMDLLI